MRRIKQRELGRMTDLSCFWVIPNWRFTDVLAFVWDGLKAVGPAAVAWVGYKVSVEVKDATQAQKDIAANQYKISLYQARSEAIHKIEAWLRDNKVYHFGSVSEHYEIINLISNLNILLQGRINFDHIRSLIAEIFMLKMEYTSKEHALSLIDDPDEYQKIEISDLKIKIISKFDFLRADVDTLLHRVRTLSTVPDAP